MTYQRPPGERLRDGVGHLQYECVCFYKQGGLLLELFANPAPPNFAPAAWADLQVATVEAWLIHVRCLLMAFREHRARRFADDLLFRDYLTPHAWNVLRDELVPDAAAQRRIDDLGVLLAHISYSRADDPRRGGASAEEYRRLDTRIRRWHEALEQEWRELFSPLGDVLRKARGGPNERAF